MAAVFDSSNPASPSAYNASQTALLLLDFQNFIIDRLGADGAAAVGKAKQMLEWALENKIMVIHSLVDATGKPPKTSKGFERITNLLAEVAKDPRNAEEPAEIAFTNREGEYLTYKHPGTISNLKNKDAIELLEQQDIKSLVICGLSTSGAVLRTSMPATDDGFIVSVIQDACCDPTEGLHDTLVKSVLPSRAHVSTAEDFIKAWKSA